MDAFGGVNYSCFDFLKPVRFSADVDDSFDPHVSSAQQPEGLFAARLSLRTRAFRAEMEFVFAQDLAVGHYPGDTSTAMEALRRDLILFSRTLVDPRQIDPAVSIEDVWCNKMKSSGIDIESIAKWLHMARQQEVERFCPIAVFLPRLSLAIERRACGVVIGTRQGTFPSHDSRLASKLAANSWLHDLGE